MNFLGSFSFFFQIGTINPHNLLRLELMILEKERLEQAMELHKGKLCSEHHRKMGFALLVELSIRGHLLFE